MTQPPLGDVPAENPSAGFEQPAYGQSPAYGPPPLYGYPPAAPGYGYPPPGYGFGYPPPGYGYHPAGPLVDKPSNNIGWAIAAIFLFWPLAIPAFIFSGKVDSAWNVGDRAGAESASRTAKVFGVIAVVAGAVLLVLIVVWFIVILALVAETVRHVPTYSPRS